MTPVVKCRQYIVGAALLLALLVQLVRTDAATAVDAGADEFLTTLQPHSPHSQSTARILLELESNPRARAHPQQRRHAPSKKYHRPAWRTAPAAAHQPNAAAASIASWTQPLQRPKQRQQFYHRRNRAPVPPSAHVLHQATVRQARTVFPAGKAGLMNRKHAVPSIHAKRTANRRRYAGLSRTHPNQTKKVFPAGKGQIMNRRSYAPSISGRQHSATATQPTSPGDLHSFRSPHVSEATMRAAGMDTHRAGNGPFDLSAYDTSDIVGSERTAHAVQENVDDTIHQAYGTMNDLGLNKDANIPERKWTPPAGKPISMAEVGGSTKISSAVHMSNPLHRIRGSTIAAHLPSHVTDTIRTVNTPETRLAQVRGIVRQVQNARAQRRKAEGGEKSTGRVKTSQAWQAVMPRSAKEEGNRDTPDDTALSFMPMWKRLLFRQ